MEKDPKHRKKLVFPAAPRTPFRAMFIAALAAAAALAAVCGWLIFRQQALLDREKALDRQVVQLEQDLDGRRSDLEQRQEELEGLRAQLEAQQSRMEEQQARLEEQQTRLDEALDTIDRLSQSPPAQTGGGTSGYAALYPNFYAPKWTGETVTGGRVCCLTFDDGPSPNTDRVLDTLDRYGVKATFFVVGNSASSAENQERMRTITAAGHAIGMHSWSHDYNKVYASVESFLAEFSQLFELIHEVTGVYPSVYRFPGGSVNGYNTAVRQEIIAEMSRRGFVYFDWNTSAGDSTQTPGAVSALTANCLMGIGRDLVVLLSHDSAPRITTPDALPAVIEGYREAGYTFSTLHPGVTPVTMG